MLRLTQHKENAENYVQDAFMLLWENKANIAVEGIKSFIFTTAYRKMIDDYRKEKVKQGYQKNAIIDQSIFSNYEDKQFVEVLLALLSPLQKAMVLLRDYEGCDYQTIAQITDTSLNQVKINIFRARKLLKEKRQCNKTN